MIEKLASGDVCMERDGKIFKIILNRPHRKNAFTLAMYTELGKALNTAARCQQTNITVLCAVGDYYSSGNDLANFSGEFMANMPTMVTEIKMKLQVFVAAFIDHPKPLIALVQGPAIGIAVTSLGLCDVVFAADNATFNTPFVELGQTPEGCSSFVFPLLMGTSVASEVLLFGRKLSAKEACTYRLVSDVFPRQQFEKLAWERVHQYANMPPKTLIAGKRLIRNDSIRKQLHAANERELESLLRCWQGDECMQAIAQFFARRAKSKL